MHHPPANLMLDNDTLGEIFSACVALESARNPTDTCLDTLKAPWVLGQVCQMWRSTALYSPFLWTSVIIRLDNVECDDAHERRLRFLLELYLSRSASYGLHVELHGGDTSLSSRKRPSFLGPLFATSPRWHTLTISMPICSYDLLSPLTGFLDSLQLLHIQYPHQSKTKTALDFNNLTNGIRIFKFCRNLQYLSLQDMPFPRDVFHLIWSNIQRISLYSSSSGLVSNPGILRTLQGLKNLTSCVIECRLMATPLRKANEVTLPVLRSLILLSAVDDSHAAEKRLLHGMSEVAQMLSWLTLPALQQLQLRHDSKFLHNKASEDGLVYEVTQLIRRSGCGLEELELGLSSSISESNIISILEVCPLLTRETLSGYLAAKPSKQVTVDTITE